MWATAKIAKPLLGKREHKQPSTSSSGKDDEVDEEEDEHFYTPATYANKRPKHD